MEFLAKTIIWLTLINPLNVPRQQELIIVPFDELSGLDTGKPLVVINHGTSEEMGMRLINDYLNRNIPSIEFIHISQGCTYKWITA